METSRKRIIDFIENQGIKPNEFLKKTGLKKGFIDRSHQNSGASDIFLSKILDVYPEINSEWLLTGKGNMLKDEKNTTYKVDDDISNMAEKPASAYKEDNANEIISLLRSQITVLENSIAIMQENKIMHAKEVARLEQDKVTMQKEINHLKQEITRLKSDYQNTEKTPSTPDASVLPLPISKSSKSQSRLRK